jgi:hypothetical protein
LAAQAKGEFGFKKYQGDVFPQILDREESVLFCLYFDAKKF